MAILDLQEALELIEGGRAEEALPLLRAWTQQMPTHAAVHVVLARAYEAAEQWKEAQNAWKGAHFLMPNSPAITEGLARVRTATVETEATAPDPLVMDLDLQGELDATLEALFNPFTLPQQAEAPSEPQEPEPPEEKDEALALAQAALAAALIDDEADEIIEKATARTETKATDAETEVLDAPEDAIELEAPPAETEIADVAETTDTAETIDLDTPEDAVEPEEPPADAETVDAAETTSAETIFDDEPTAGAPSIYDEIEQLIEEKQGRKKPAETEAAETEHATETAPPLDRPPAPESPSIYDEIEQLIEEKEERKKPAEATPEAETPPAETDVATAQEEEQTLQEDVAEEVLDVEEENETPLEEEKRAIAALEALVREAADEETTDDLDDWQDFEEEPEEAPAPQREDLEDLERLINELESARIVPQPELDDDLPPPDLDDDIEGMVSETLARIYASQKQYREAARIYEQLALQHPDEEERFTLLASEMHALAGKGES